MRLRYAEDPSNPRLRGPGEVTRVVITLYPTGNLFLTGHRIRLDISSSNFPKFDVNRIPASRTAKRAANASRAIPFMSTRNGRGLIRLRSCRCRSLNANCLKD